MTSTTRRGVLGGALGVAALSLGLAGCDQTGSRRDAPNKIRFATDWHAQAEQGGFYQALATGLYAKRGLDVEIIQGGPSVNVPQLLASEAVDLGLGSNSLIVLNLAAQDAPIKAVAAFMQKDPQVLLAHKDLKAQTLKDLVGHPIFLSDATLGAFWPWLKARFGFRDQDVRKYPGNPAPFLSDPRSIQQGYVTSEPYIIEKEGHIKPEIFLLADHGYGSYAALVLANERILDEDAHQVEAFNEASAEGWISYLNKDPKPADALIMQHNPEMTPDILAQAREKMRKYQLVEGGDASVLGVGVMTQSRWGAFFKEMSQAGLYKPNLDYRQVIRLDLQPGAKARTRDV